MLEACTGLNPGTLGEVCWLITASVQPFRDSGLGLSIGSVLRHSYLCDCWACGGTKSRKIGGLSLDCGGFGAGVSRYNEKRCASYTYISFTQPRSFMKATSFMVIFSSAVDRCLQLTRYIWGDIILVSATCSAWRAHLKFFDGLGYADTHIDGGRQFLLLFIRGDGMWKKRT